MKINTFVIACALSLFASFSHAEFSYKPKGCEFSVDFPRVPKFERIYALSGEATEQAQLINGDNFYRAHCVAAPKGVNSSEAKAVEMARKFASNQGLTNPEIRYVQTERGYRMNMRATKMLQGVYATYEIQCSYGRQSYLCVGVGGPSAVWPTPSLTKFLTSVKNGRLRPQFDTLFWSEVALSDIGTHFLDFNSIDVTGPIVRAIVMTNFHSAVTGRSGTDILSSTSVKSFDCAARKVRFEIDTSYYSAVARGPIEDALLKVGLWQSPTKEENSMLEAVCKEAELRRVVPG